MTTIRLLSKEQIEPYMEHLARHLPEPGINGIISQPFPIGVSIDKDKISIKTLERWANKPGEGAWEVAWGLFDGDQIVGHLELIGTAMPALRHRAKLGMGIEHNYRSKGFGKKLIQTGLTWARSQDFLSWIDLEVFAHNKAALKLYQSFGFQRIGKTPDRIRVNQESIDDIHFALNLKTENGLPEGFSIKECSAEEFNKIVGPLKESIFGDNELTMWPRDVMTNEENLKLAQLNEDYKANFSLYLVLFYQNKLAGWTSGYQDTRESFCMSNSAVLPEYRGKSLYSYLLNVAILILTKKGFQRIWSSHQMTNNKIIVPKLKRGFVITGSSLNDIVGLLVHLTFYTNKTRKKVVDFRVGHIRPDQEIKDVFKI